MRILLLFISSLFFVLKSDCQKISFKQKLKIYINGHENKAYQVRFIKTDYDTIMKPTAQVYSSDGKLLNYQLQKTPNWNASKAFNKDSVNTIPEILQRSEYHYADISTDPDNNRLLIYFWPFSTKKKDCLFDKPKELKGDDSVKTADANNFLKNNSFSISLDDRILVRFRTMAFQAGVLTIPIRTFLGAPDSVSSIETTVSVGSYIGIRFGTTKYVKLPNQKDYTTYQIAYSINIFGGLNKLDLDEKNTKDAAKKFKGSIASLSLGIAPAYHFKNFTTFLASGFDIPLSSKGSNWSLKGKPWIGVGFGFDIF